MWSSFVIVAALQWAAFDSAQLTEPKDISAVPRNLKESAIFLSADVYKEIYDRLNSIYKKIRFEKDPAELPPLYFLNITDANAFVSDFSDKALFFNAQYLLKVPFEEILAVTLGHEPNHFKKTQARRIFLGGSFLNEVDAEVGMIQRLLRQDPDKPAVTTPEPLPFHIPTILEYFDARNDYSSTHPNRAHISALLRQSYMREYSKRREVKKSTPFTLSERAKEELEWGITHSKPGQVIESEMSTSTTQAKNKMVFVQSLFEDPFEKIRDLSDRLFMATMDVLNTVSTDRRLLDDKHFIYEKLTPLREMKADILNAASLIQKIENPDKLKAGFSKWKKETLYSIALADAMNNLLGCNGPMAACEQLSQNSGNRFLNVLIDTNQFFLNLNETGDKKNKEFPLGELYRRNNSNHALQFYEFSLNLLHIYKNDLLTAIRRKNLSALEAALYFLKHNQFKKSGLYNDIKDAFLEAIQNLDVQQVITALEAQKASSALLIALDHGFEVDDITYNRITHKLPHGLRKQIVLKLNPLYYLSTSRSLASGDSAILEAQIKRLAENPIFFSALMSYLPDIAKSFGVNLEESKIDDIYSAAISQKIAELESDTDEIKKKNIIEEQIEYWAEIHARFTKAEYGLPSPIAQSYEDPALILKLILKRGDFDIDTAGLMSIFQTTFSNNLRRSDSRNLESTQFDMDNFLKQMGLHSDWLSEVVSLRGQTSLAEFRLRSLQKTSDKLIEYFSNHPLLLIKYCFDFSQHSDNSYKQSFYETLPWKQIFERLTPAQILTTALMRPSVGRDTLGFSKQNYLNSINTTNHLQNNHKLAQGRFIGSYYRRVIELLKTQQLSIEETLAILGQVNSQIPLNVPEQKELIKLLHERILKSDHPQEIYRFLSVLSPQMFSSYSDFRHFLMPILLRPFEQKNILKLNLSERKDLLSSLLGEYEKALLQKLGPIRLKDLFNQIAETVQSIPAEKPIFTLHLEKYEGTAATSLIHINQLLEIYDSLLPDQKWDLLQWFRGKNTELAELIQHKTQDLLLKQGYVLHSANQIESYLREQYDHLGSSARASFFHIALYGSSQLILHRKIDQKIKNEVFSGFPQQIRETIIELYDAVQYAVPPAFRELIIPIIFAESGKAGSPEDALYMVLSQMGPLVKKFGQTLAFDEHLPLSYRLKLQKLWDEVPHPGWWSVYDLLLHQYGDLISAGYRMVDIRNSGTTEIVVELRGPRGESRIVAVEHIGLERGAEVDEELLREFVNYLTTKAKNGGERYGFLKFITSDTSRTFKLERDRNHKPQIAPAMKATYLEAIKNLGGIQKGDLGSLKNWNFEFIPYESTKLTDQKTFLSQPVAKGVPLKNIQKDHPELYKEISEIILAVENRAQDLKDRPIDKDRMPGQVLVDISNRTITLLDHGQAKYISPQAFGLRDLFLTGSFTANPWQIAEVLKSLGVPIKKNEMADLKKSLMSVSQGFRPLQAFHWLSQKKYLDPEKLSQPTEDLLHLVRAKLRLAQWAQSIQSSTIEDSLKKSGVKAAVSLPGLAAIGKSCANSLIELLRSPTPEAPR